MKELQKNYNPKEMEDRIYKMWEESGAFHAEVDPDKKPFTIVMPPPNITGQLHMGHALDNTLQDILIRYKRMQGYSALWQPGTDHASIATELKITEALRKEGIDKRDLGREAFLERAWKWRDEYGNRIVHQLKKLGCSADWARERFTMDEGCSKAVREVFCRLYEKGYIYKGKRMINWCPACKTSLSDAEVEHEEMEGHFWHVLYPFKDGDGGIVIATTRPETLLGDTAVAVNPEDERYKDLIGKTLILPLVGREIPVIADEYVDKDFGTGCVKITPAHDPNDYEVGLRHNLELIEVMTDDGKINENGGAYEGLDRFEARKRMVEDLEKQGLLVKVEPHTHNVGTHERCGSIVEPLAKEQWFVRMEEMARPALEALKTGKLKIVPERFEKMYINWLTNIRDWCISRQLWWGHRIPVWTCEECGEVIVSREDPTECPKCHSAHLVQDPDTLDTWFSSALWPFSTLGWPEETPELQYFYPTDVLVTGYDILFFWVIRMMFSALEQTGEVPFHTVFLHGLVLDEKGRKMSKSLGNGVDPLVVIDETGADALRLLLINGISPGGDIRYSDGKLMINRNFINKIWNVSRLIRMNTENEVLTKPEKEDLRAEDRWILHRMNALIPEVSKNLDKFELGIAFQKMSDFFWSEFCDWYVEMVKTRLWNKEDPSRMTALHTLREVLITSLKLLHPYIPFLTEEIYDILREGDDLLIRSSWPVYTEDYEFEAEERRIEYVREMIKQIRELRRDMDIPPSKKAACHIVSDSEDVRLAFTESEGFFRLMAGIEDLTVEEKLTLPESGNVSAVCTHAVAYLPLKDLLDIEKEKERLKKEEASLLKELERSHQMLTNERFLMKAPEAKIREEEQKKKDYETKLEKVRELLQSYEA